LDLREMEMIGRQFTLANSLPDLTYEKLDRILMDADWETKFPMVSVRALEHIEGFLDHAPILMTTGGPSRQTNHRFKFELGWLELTGFMIWSKVFGRDRLVLALRYKGGIIRCGLYVATLGDGLSMNQVFLKKKSKGSQSLSMIWRPWRRCIRYHRKK
jgi:hypothetical protein